MILMFLIASGAMLLAAVELQNCGLSADYLSACLPVLDIPILICVQKI